MIFGQRNKLIQKRDECRRRIIRILLSEMQSSAKAQQLASTNNSPPDPSGSYKIEEILNIPYMNRREVALGMDIYKPVMPENTDMPVIVTLYGGGLVQGDRKSSRPYARELASRGYLVFAKGMMKMNNSNHTGNMNETNKRRVVYWEELLKNRKSETSMSDSMETMKASTYS